MNPERIVRLIATLILHEALADSKSKTLVANLSVGFGSLVFVVIYLVAIHYAWIAQVEVQ